MDNEIDCLDKNYTWILVNRDKNKHVLDVKWVYTIKSKGKYKARLVVRGFQQKNVIDDIYSPVASSETLKFLISFCCQNGLIIEQMDVETAFLNGKVSTEVYQVYKYETGNDIYVSLGKTIRSVKPNH